MKKIECLVKLSVYESVINVLERRNKRQQVIINGLGFIIGLFIILTIYLLI